MASKKLNAASIGRNSAARAETRSTSLLTPEGIEPIRPLQLQPVQAGVYQTIFELNAGFEAVIRHFAALEQIEYLWDEKLNAIRNLICRAQAEINFHILEPISERELSNSSWYDRLCYEWEKQIADPGRHAQRGRVHKTGAETQRKQGSKETCGITQEKISPLQKALATECLLRLVTIQFISLHISGAAASRPPYLSRR